MHPDEKKDIVLSCVVLHNMLRAKRGAGGREMNLEDEKILTDFEDRDPGDGHDRNPPTVPRNRGTT